MIMKPTKSQQLSESFIKDIRTIIERGRQQAYAAAGSVMFATNWEVGRRIVEEEQHGNARAQYGKQVIAMLANNLKDDYGSCYGKRNLAYYRQFYLAFSDLSILHTRVQNLTWSHIRRVLSVSNSQARVWYLNSAAEENWSVRTLGRNISSQYYERRLAWQRDNNNELPDIKAVAPYHDSDPLEYIKNPTIGVLLCTDTDSTVAKYSVLNESQQLFASKYMPYMPTEEELRHEIEQQKQFFLEHHKSE